MTTARSDPRALVASAPHDYELRVVVGDALAARGDPQGELAIVQYRLEHHPDDRELVAREAELLGLLAPHLGRLDPESVEQVFGATWRRGWIETLRFQLTGWAWDDELRTINVRFGAAIASPTCSLIDELAIIVTDRWARDVVIEDYLVELVRCGPYPGLRSLTLGGFVEHGRDGTAWCGRDISAIYIGNRNWPDGRSPLYHLLAMCPAVETVRIHGNCIYFGPLTLPVLKQLEVCTSSFGIESLDLLMMVEWPALEQLVLWFGDCEYGGDSAPCSADDVMRLIESLDHKCPRLTQLTLANLPCSDGVAVRLASSEAALLRRLTSFDLSLGTLGPIGATALAAARDRFAVLRELNVADNYISPAEIANLERTYTGCMVKSAGQRTTDGPQEDRYPAVGE